MRRIGLETEKWRYRLLSLTLCLVVAAGTGAEDLPEVGTPATAAPVQSRSGVFTGLGAQALSRDFPDQAVWLELADGGQALGLFLPAYREPAKGALVLLGDAGDTAASGLAGSLRRQLSERGWATLTLALEAPSPSLQPILETLPSPRPEDSGDTGIAVAPAVVADADGDDTGPEAMYRRRVRQMLAAALAELAGRGFEQPVMLGVGHACNYLAYWPDQAGIPEVMIWIAPVFYPRFEGGLKAWLENSTSLTVLELSSLRPGAVQGSGRPWYGLSGYSYQPVVMARPPSVQDAGAVAGRIHGWLMAR